MFAKSHLAGIVIGAALGAAGMLFYANCPVETKVAETITKTRHAKPAAKDDANSRRKVRIDNFRDLVRVVRTTLTDGSPESAEHALRAPVRKPAAESCQPQLGCNPDDPNLHRPDGSRISALGDDLEAGEVRPPKINSPAPNSNR